MKDVIQKLDIRRRQVYVEVAIIEMSLSKMRDLGFELQAPVQTSSLSENATKVSTVGGTNFGNIGNVIANGPAALAQMSGLAVGAIKGTFTFQGKQYLSVGALLHALQTDGNVNVLSTPNLLTMDNQKAEIMVGQNVPFITGQTQNAVTGSQTLFNTVNRQDVGIKLSLTPQIASDDNVRLEVNQEISDVIASTLTNLAGPTTSKRSASTTVVVKDRQTMVIGGLIRDNVTSSESKVPFLGDIPILGWLFKSKTTSIDKTNLMIFITPYIIKNENEAGDLTRQKNDDLEKFRKEYRIEKKGVEPVILTPKAGEAAEQPAPGVKSQIYPMTPAQGMKSEITPTTPPRLEELLAPAMQSGVTATIPAEAAPVQPAEQPAPAQDMGSSPTTTQQPAPTVVPQEGVR
jgi:general secretion pathway protein D